jgi:hypothetical protein
MNTGDLHQKRKISANNSEFMNFVPNSPPAKRLEHISRSGKKITGNAQGFFGFLRRAKFCLLISYQPNQRRPNHPVPIKPAYYLDNPIPDL